MTFEQKRFRQALIDWYSQHGRDLPWRRTRDPYRILVSEFMLQQTRVATVLPHYKEWLRRFPSFAALARAPEQQALHAWQGLGYYARARNLRATARIVVDRHCGRFPKEIAAMQKLPGVGRYTAYAMATFALEQAVPIIEANTARVLSRLFDLRVPIDSTAGQRALWHRAASLVPKQNAVSYNSALLDLGALVCLPGKPKCEICPVKKFCATNDPESLPLKRPQSRTKHLIEKHVLTVRQNKILLEAADRRWRGMWILPSANGDAKSNGAIYQAAFSFTNHRIRLQIFPGQVPKIDHRRVRWFSRRELKSIPIPSPHRRAITKLLNMGHLSASVT